MQLRAMAGSTKKPWLVPLSPTAARIAAWEWTVVKNAASAKEVAE